MARGKQIERDIGVGGWRLITKELSMHETKG